MYQIRDIASMIDAQVMGQAPLTIDWLLTDSRSLCFPENTLFFALRSERGDGHRYIHQLYNRGVRAFVVDTLPSQPCPEAVFLLVPSPLAALQRLAMEHRKRFQLPVVGIAGSNGKTTVKEWLYQMLSPDYAVVRSPRSYNSRIGVPLSVWSLAPDHQLALFEAGISQPGEMDVLEPIIRPTIGLFTGLGEAHQEHFSSMEQKCAEKLRLFRHAQVLIYLKGNPVVDQCVRKMDFKGTLMPCASTGNALADDMELCRALCLHMGMDRDTVDKRMASLHPVAMRLEVLEGVRGCTIINDTYNSDPDSLFTALDFMNRRPERTNLRRTLVLSDIMQTGITPPVLYAQVARLVRQREVDEVLAVGTALSSCRQLFEAQHINIRCFSSTRHLMESGVLDTLSDRLVLLKGAHAFHFEQVADMLVRRMHETILEVDLNAVVDNLNHYRAMLHPGVKMVCMVKADAYGAGALEVAKVLQEHHVDYLAVAVADEGVALRNAGITSNIIVMNPEMSSLRLLFQYHLEPEVYSFRLLEALLSAAAQEGIAGFPVHLKLDTGMHRMGFSPTADMPRLLQLLTGQSALLPRSVFSHFVGSDDDSFDEFSARQYSLFSLGANALQKAFSHPILRHICNSAAIEHFPDWQMDMVRLGLGLYGINSRNNQPIHNVSTLKTTILQIHQVPAGDSIGYGRHTFVERDSRIASIPIGYADGLNRHLGNRHGYCMVAGHRAPYMGNICMDVCMIDVTGIPCKEGDQVIIFGEELPVSVLSDAIDTIPYELLTGVSPRVKRIYFKG